MAGGGVGEAMLIGAVTGAGTSAVTGGDPLKGALLGAVGGGATAGIGGLGGAGGGASGGASGGAGAATTTPAFSSAATQVAPGAAGNVGMQTAGFGNTVGSLSSPTTAGSVGTFGNVGASGLGNAALPGAGATAGAPAAVPSSFDLRSLPSTGDLLSRKDEIQTTGSALANLINKYPVGAPAAGGFLATAIGSGQPGIDDPRKKYRGPLSRFSYNPDSYIPAFADGGIADLPVSTMASGGIADLGSYSDGGRLLKGPGDGMSDSIPAKIGRKQPARLADGEFVVPADVVSGLGNGSTDAGAKQLYAMMDKVRQARTGNKKQGKQINPRKYVPA